MAFSFGGNAFGATQSKPAFSFGNATSTATTASGFGGFGTAATTASTGFGTFGTPANTGLSTGAFGSTQAFGTGTPGFGTGTSGFGSGTTGFGTGQSTFGTGQSTFGTGTSTFGTGNTSFGIGTSAFGTGTSGFGTGTTGFGTGTSTFGNTSTFGATLGANTLGSNALGSNTFGNTSFGGGALGSNTLGGLGSNTFGSTFNKPATTGFGGFGTGLGTAFGQQQQQQQQAQTQGQTPASPHEALIAAVFNCSVFGDERDHVLAKWNLIQAQWGTGQAYYSRNAPPLELNEQNPLCRFKAVGYNKLGGKEDRDGNVALLLNKPSQEIKNNQQNFISSLAGLLGNKPNLAVHIESITDVAENKCQVTVYVVDSNAGGSRVSANELANFLKGGQARAALSGAGCYAVNAAVKPSAQQIEQYLQSPPPGMDIRLWKQAQADNPDPKNYIPVPIVGFSEIKSRVRWQSEQAALQGGYLRSAEARLAELGTRRCSALASLATHAALLHAAQHKLLQILGRREVAGRAGIPLSPEEEEVRARLHELHQQLASPQLYSGRLNELLCSVRLQRSASSGAAQERYQLDPDAQEDLKQYLSLQQKSMAHLMQTVKEDLELLNTISDGLSKLAQA